MRVGGGYSDGFGVGVQQGSVPSPLLFIIVLEVLSLELSTGCRWELLYADNMVAITDSLEELLVKVQMWKSGMEKKGLRVNMGKKKIMVPGANMDLLKKSGTHPGTVCFTGTERNAICCGCRSLLVHNKIQWHQGTPSPRPRPKVCSLSGHSAAHCRKTNGSGED